MIYIIRDSILMMKETPVQEIHYGSLFGHNSVENRYTVIELRSDMFLIVIRRIRMH